MQSIGSRRFWLAGALVASLAACSQMGSMMGGGSAGAKASATSVRLAATLAGAQEVPPVSTSATGRVEATFDRNTSKLAYTVEYTGLSGPARAGHFHGPAAPGQNAGVVVPFPSAANPVRGEATLTPAQAADLLAGRWYVNLHTAAHPGGEIRGQLTAQ